MECSVPDREERVAEAENVTYDALIRFIEKIRFTALAIQVCMRPEEWRESANPIPTHKHLRLRVAEEAPDVGYVSIRRQYEVKTNIREK